MAGVDRLCKQRDVSGEHAVLLQRVTSMAGPAASRTVTGPDQDRLTGVLALLDGVVVEMRHLLGAAVPGHDAQPLLP